MSVSLEHASVPDGELARRIREASPDLARAEEAELCVRFARRIRLYGLRHLGDEDAAADLVQRVLQLTLEKLRRAQVREHDRIASFILGTARMVAQEMGRKARRQTPLPDGSEPGPAEASVPLEERTPIPREQLAGCLQALSERERTVVLMTFFQEQTASQMARALGATEGNIRVIRHRALRRLRGCMAEGELR